MTLTVSPREQFLKFSVVNSNRLLFAGLATILAGTMVLAAAHSYLNDRVWIQTGNGYGLRTSHQRVLFGLGFGLGGFSALVAVLMRVGKDEKGGRPPQRYFWAALVAAAALFLYASLVCALRNSGEVIPDVVRDGASPDDYLIPNEGPLKALQGISYTVMIVGTGVSGAGFSGYLASRTAANHLKKSEVRPISEGDAV
jgi:hypothetical protein